MLINLHCEQIAWLDNSLTGYWVFLNLLLLNCATDINLLLIKCCIQNECVCELISVLWNFYASASNESRSEFGSTFLFPPNSARRWPGAPEPGIDLFRMFPSDKSPVDLIKQNKSLWGRPLAGWSLLFSAHTESRKIFEDLNRAQELSF